MNIFSRMGVIILILLAFAGGALADEAADRDVAAVQKLLKQKFPDDTWGRGPSRLTNKAIETAYPKSRFYYVFSPQYPVARSGQISAIVQINDVQINDQGSARLIEQPQDRNHGLMAIHGADDAQTAAAAIMSLTLGPMGPQEVGATDVEVAAAGQGWTAKSSRPQGRWDVAFDAQGQCTAADYKHTGPLPICIGGQFRAVAAPPGLTVGGLLARVGLLTESVVEGSIARQAGLQTGDLVIGFGGQPLPGGDTIQKLRQIVYALKQQGGVTRSVMVVRDGQILTVTLAW